MLIAIDNILTSTNINNVLNNTVCIIEPIITDKGAVWKQQQFTLIHRYTKIIITTLQLCFMVLKINYAGTVDWLSIIFQQFGN